MHKLENGYGPLAYRLLACDLDGTLMGDDTEIPPRVRQTVTMAQALGVQFTLATGRSYPAALPFARTLNVTLPLICYQGGLIKHPSTGAVLHRAKMEPALLLEVIELAQAHDWHLVAYLEDDVYLEEFRRPRRFYEDLLGANLYRVQDLAATIQQSGLEPAKFVLVADKLEADRVEAELRARYAPSGDPANQRMVVVRSHDFFVEGNPLGVTKGAALRRLAEHLGVPQRQVMAIGDQDNDISMIAWAGLGVAMGGASDGARAVANWVAPPLSAHGAAVAIERFIQGG